MAFKALLKSTNCSRASERRALLLTTSGHDGSGAKVNVTVHNLSAAGLLLQTALKLDVGDHLTIDLPDAGSAEAVIVWRSNQLYGCTFREMLSSGALAAIQLQGGGRPHPATSEEAARGNGIGGIGADFGHKLNKLRRDRGMTLADVAKALGVSVPTIWAWEKGKARPMPERMDAIAAAFGVSLRDLTEVHKVDAEVDALIEECRNRIASAFNIAPTAVRVMIDL